MLLANMDAYNDAATDALRKHRQQYLFVEIEAEVNLCFDQVLFLLAEQVYTHYKTRAALMTSGDTRAPGSVDGEGDKQAARALGKSWYDTLLSQRCVTLLGRCVDLAQLLGQRMNTMLRQSIETAVARFESRDVTAVLELRALLRTAQLTHTLLDKTLPDIDPFEQIFMEANDQMTFLSFSSRIASHALKEVLRPTPLTTSLTTTPYSISLLHPLRCSRTCCPTLPSGWVTISSSAPLRRSSQSPPSATPRPR